MLHSGKNFLTVKAIPGSCNYNGTLVVLAKKLNTLGGLLLACGLCMRKHDSRCVSDLIVIKLTEVLHIHLALLNVGNGCKAVKDRTVLLCTLSSADNIRKLTNARGLDNNSVGVVFLKHLNKSLGKITYKRATDTARVHLGDLNARVGKEATVNTDLAKLILDENYLLACICFLYQLLNQCGFARTEEAGKYINFCHFLCSFRQYFYKYYFTTNILKCQGKMNGIILHTALHILTAKLYAKQDGVKGLGCFRE